MSEPNTVSVSIEELRIAMATDCVTILGFYLEDELDLEVPELHEEIWDDLVAITQTISTPGEWIDHIQKLFCVPRGHSKSTLAKLAVILFFRYSPISFTLYTSLTSAIAIAACKDIVEWLRSPQDEAVYGSTTMIQSNEQKQLWIMEIGMPFTNKRKVVILKALGADQQVRGTLIKNRRPELMIFDDIEDNDTAQDEKSQKKHDIWLMGNLMKASARKSVRIIIGNMINSRTMLYRFSKDPEWNPTVYGAIVRNRKTGKLQSLWPDLWTLEALLKDYRDYRNKGVGHVWVYEMMNMTQDTIFKTGMDGAIRIPRPAPDQVTSGIIILDPAFGKNSWNDNSAFTVHVKIKGSSIPHIVESRKGKWSEDRLLDEFVELSNYWNIGTWGIESVAAQKLLIPYFKALLDVRKMPKGIFTMIPLMSGGVSKPSRIHAFVQSASSGNYGVCQEEEDLVSELSLYDPQTTTSDDLPDSAAYGIIAWSQSGIIIESDGFLQEKLALMQQEQMQSVCYSESEMTAF